MKAGDHASPPGGPSRPFVLRVGLTGGIATGKSTVAKHFAARGAVVADADAYARALVEPGAAGYEPVVKSFGRSVVLPDETIDRAALAAIVFADPEKRARLESILHPLILAEEETFVERLAAEGAPRVAVINAALLVEAGTWRRYHRLVVVHCDEETQVERIAVRDGLTRDEALARIRAQMPAAEKLAVAHYAIDTSGGFEATETRAREVWRHLELDLAALSMPRG